jgi:hypoxanthine-guanine phosphoribosyltransferase
LEGGGEQGLLPPYPTLIVDDLVDSGKTLAFLKGRLTGTGEIKTAVLIRKFGEESGPVDFCGFDLNLDREALAQKGLADYWLFGYGMDLDGAQRELDHIGWVGIRKE